MRLRSRIGFPVVVKPIDGAGSADTYTAADDGELESVLAMVGHVPEVAVEEFIDGEEYTFDTVCANGQVLFQNVTWYRPKPLVTRLNPWISQTAICLRDLDRPTVAPGVELGHRVLEALGFDTGFTHMEWFLTPSGEAVFGEIGARSPGGRLPHGMNLSADVDVFKGWAEAVCYGSFSQDTAKGYNAAHWCLSGRRATDLTSLGLRALNRSWPNTEPSCPSSIWSDRANRGVTGAKW